jgi:putative ABC transport system permease protein
MQLWEGVVLAMEQLRSQKLKSFFSLLGVILGVTFLIVVVTVVEGMDRYVREDFTSQVFGVNTVTLRRWPDVNINTSQEEWRARLRRPRIRREDVQAVREQLTVPARIAEENRGGADVVGDNGRTATGVSVLGASPELFEIRDLSLAEGRAFTPQEAADGTPVLVIGSETAEVVFQALDPVGRGSGVSPIGSSACWKSAGPSSASRWTTRSSPPPAPRSRPSPRPAAWWRA